jgi:penicillin-binding protein 2
MTPVKPPNFDPIEDLRQTGMRLQIIYYLAIAIFAVLIGRLWFLQVMNSGVYAERADANRIRILPIPARRGTILDRHGKVLVTSKASYNIVLSRKDALRNFNEIAEVLVRNLDIEREWLSKRFEAAKYEPKYESIVVKELASPSDVAWVEAHQLEYPMIRAEEAPQRVYVYGPFAAHALGYVGEVSQKELKSEDGQFSAKKGFKLGDIIGKSGIERTYNEILMGKDGERRVLVDSRGRIQKEIERIEPIPGRDLFTTLDYDIQKAAEAQADTMPAGRGAVAVMNPNDGEILSMVSRPAFDPNLFSQMAKTPEGKEEISRLYEEPDKPLYNRVIQGAFPPGSTWKLFTTVAALNERVITPEHSRIQDGGIQLGNYFMSSMSNLGMPDVVTAIVHSSDGYFYRLGLKMGPERFEKWLNIFRFGKATGIDLPNERDGTPPARQTKLREYERAIKRVEKELQEATDKTLRAQLEFKIKQLRREAEWTDYDMASSAFGQGRNATPPIQLLRYVGGLANGGFMHTPHLLLRAVPGTDRFGRMQSEVRYEDRNRFQVPMSAEIHEIVKKGMWGAVNAGGTAGGARVEGFDVCGKTGTAQVASKDKAGAKNKDHAWFISFAPRDKPEICSVILTENAGFGGTHSAPRAKAIYEDYYRRTRGITEPLAEEAKKSSEPGVRSPESKPKSGDRDSALRTRN